jgi:hypothetical protein
LCQPSLEQAPLGFVVDQRQRSTVRIARLVRSTEAPQQLSARRVQVAVIDRRRYRTLRDAFRRYLRHGAVFHQYELNRYHVLGTDLIAPIDHWYRLQHGDARPMGAVDHIVISMGINLCRINGHDSVALLTADRRMARAIRRASSLNRNTAAALDLPTRAEELAYRWRPEIYPQVFDLERGSDKALREFFGEWPLPTRLPRGVPPRAVPFRR